MIHRRPFAGWSLTPPRLPAWIFSADRAVAELQQDLAKAGVVLALVVVSVKHRADLERMGLIDLIGANRIFDSRHARLAAYNSECLLGSDTQADRWLTVLPSDQY
jgi:MFS superfamily sulfate permease-like transporter